MRDEEQARALRSHQIERETTEERLAHLTDDQREAEQHERRAEKARYLREKLEERERSEREAREED